MKMTTVTARNILIRSISSAAFALCALTAHAQSPADFYKGKNLDVMIGYSVGGGYDLHWDMKFDCQDKFIWEWTDEPKKFEWKRGDYVYIPPFTNHQHFATEESRIIVMSNRIIKDMGFDWHDQLENAPGF